MAPGVHRAFSSQWQGRLDWQAGMNAGMSATIAYGAAHHATTLTVNV